MYVLKKLLDCYLGNKHPRVRYGNVSISKKQTQNSREQIFNRSFSGDDNTTTRETCAVAKL